MFSLYGNSLRDQARAHHLPVILPGDPEPVWLRHSAEISAILASGAPATSTRSRSTGARASLLACASRFGWPDVLRALTRSQHRRGTQMSAPSVVFQRLRV